MNVAVFVVRPAQDIGSAAVLAILPERIDQAGSRQTIEHPASTRTRTKSLTLDLSQWHPLVNS